MKLQLTIILFVLSLVASAQETKHAMYSLCGKECIGEITFDKDEFIKCEKTLVPLNAKDKIDSFILSMVANGNYIDLKVTGNFGAAEKEMLGRMTSGSKIVLEKVKILRADKIISAPDVIIKIK